MRKRQGRRDRLRSRPHPSRFLRVRLWQQCGPLHQDLVAPCTRTLPVVSGGLAVFREEWKRGNDLWARFGARARGWPRGQLSRSRPIVDRFARFLAACSVASRSIPRARSRHRRPELGSTRWARADSAADEDARAPAPDACTAIPRPRGSTSHDRPPPHGLYSSESSSVHAVASCRAIDTTTIAASSRASTRPHRATAHASAGMHAQTAQGPRPLATSRARAHRHGVK